MSPSYFFSSLLILASLLTACSAKVETEPESPVRSIEMVRQIRHGDVIHEIVQGHATLDLKPQFGIIAEPRADLSDCRARIPRILCLVDEPITLNRRASQRPCLPGAEPYVAPFEAHFDRSPPLIRRMYCSLAQIYIEKEFDGTAYALYVTDVKDNMRRLLGAGFGIRRSILDSPPSRDEWRSWKEETSFGGSTTTNERLGIIQYHSNQNTTEGLLDDIINHEFGHLFDTANTLNSFIDCEYKKNSSGTGDTWEQVGACAPFKGSWGELSWRTHEQVSSQNDYPLRDQLCFYSCNGKFLDPNQAATLFAGLIKSPFSSTYGSTFPREDWAEAFASYLAYVEQGLELTVTAGGQTQDLRAHFMSPVMAAKRKFIQSFIEKGPHFPLGTED